MSAPLCPFCAAPWTAAMIAAYDAAGNGGCSCCEPAEELAPALENVHVHDGTLQDIACAACGQVLYRLAPEEAAR
jgi:hypothetical protein